MTEQQFNKFREKLTEFAMKHKDELTLIREDLVKAITEVKEELAAEKESEGTNSEE